MSVSNQTETKLADVLLEIESQMRSHNLWSAQRPTAEQLASVEPFCVDSLSFPEWLQFVFLPRMKDILEQGSDLPATSEIAPMAEHYLAQNALSAKGLISAIADFDALIG